MFDPERLYRSWALTNAALQVLRANRQLAVFPILSGVLSLFVFAAFAIPVCRDLGLLAGEPDYTVSATHLFVYYAAQFAVAFFVNTALIGAALMCLRGQQPTFAGGIRLAASQIGPILGYSALAVTVGTLLRFQRRRFRALGRLFIDLLGMTWDLATYLVAPVLIVEKLGPVAAAKRSAELLQHTWGEQIIGNAGINLVFNWFMFLLTPLLLLAYYGVHHNLYILALAAVVLLVLSVLILFVIRSTLSGIYTAAVYLYASDDFIVEQFDADLVRDAFRPQVICVGGGIAVEVADYRDLITIQVNILRPPGRSG